MKTSKPLFARALLLLVLVAIPPGCGSSGKRTLSDSETLALFLFGDLLVQAGNTEILFTVGGAPSDGSVRRIDPAEATAKLLTQGLNLFFLEFLAIVYEVAGTQPVALELSYDLPDLVEDSSLSDAEIGLAIALGVPLYQDQDGTMYLAEDTEIDVDRTTYRARAQVYETNRFGIADTGFRADLRGSQSGDQVAYEFGVEQTQPGIGASYSAQIWFNGSLALDLGTFPPNTLHQSSGSFTVPASQLATPIELRLTTGADPFWRSWTVRCKQDLSLNAVPDPRVYDLSFGAEGVEPIDKRIGEFIRPLRAPFGYDTFPVATAGEGLVEGEAQPAGILFAMDVADPATGQTTYRLVYVGPEYPDPGSDPYWLRTASHQALATPTTAARILVGAYGVSIANFDTTLMDFEAHVVQEAGNMTDVCPFDGDRGASRLVYVDNSADAIKFIETDAQDRFTLAPGLTITNSAWAGASGRVVSAFRHPSGDLLFCTDGDPGELWVMTPGSTTATKIADTYGAPRTVRCAGNIVAVGCYGSALGFGGLRLLVRGPTGVYTNAPFSRLGARAVGIDVKELSGGRVAIATTGFLTDNLIVTIVDGSTGEILDDQVIPLPAGCTGPGHCAFVRDAGVDAVFVTCNTSNQLVLMPVDLDP